jgi:hypothetical protein
LSDIFSTGDDLDEWTSEALRGEPVEPTPVEADTVAEVESDEAPAEQADTAAEERPRNADGTFAAKATQEETPAETEARLFAGKYKTPDELEAAYSELQSLTGRQGQEIGEMRRLIEQVQAQTQPQPQPVQAESLQERLYENPHEIIPMIQNAHAAALRGDASAGQVRNIALATLRDVNAVAAEEVSQWVAQSTFQAQQQQQTQAQSQLDGAWQQAAEEFAASAPDFNNLAPQIAELAGRPENADLLKLLEVGGPQARISVLRVLYNEARGQATDTLNNLSQEIAATHAADEQRAAQAAHVVSAAATKPAPAAPSRADEIAASWEAIEAPHRDGWQL